MSTDCENEINCGLRKMQKAFSPDGMPSYQGFYPPENGFKYENGYGGGHYGTPAPDSTPLGLYYGGNCAVGLQNQNSLGGPVGVDGCPPLGGEYGEPPNNGHYPGMGGGPCGQGGSLTCPPGLGLHVGIGGKQQTEIYPWMKESRQNNKRQSVAGRYSSIFFLFTFYCEKYFDVLLFA